MCLSSSASSASHPQLKALTNQSRRRSWDHRASLRHLSPAAHLASFPVGREEQAARAARTHLRSMSSVSSRFSLPAPLKRLSGNAWCCQVPSFCLWPSAYSDPVQGLLYWQPGPCTWFTSWNLGSHGLWCNIYFHLLMCFFSQRQEKHISSSNSNPLSALYSIERLAFKTGNKWSTFKGEDLHKAAMT